MTKKRCAVVGIGHRSHSWIPQVTQTYREQAELVRQIAQFPGPVVCQSMLYSLLAGKPIPFETAIVKQTAASGVFDETPLVERTNQGFFDAFVVMAGEIELQLSPRMQEAIRLHYKPYPIHNSLYRMWVRQ